jgi:hypothetical protein
MILGIVTIVAVVAYLAALAGYVLGHHLGERDGKAQVEWDLRHQVTPRQAHYESVRAVDR